MLLAVLYLSLYKDVEKGNCPLGEPQDKYPMTAAEQRN